MRLFILLFLQQTREVSKLLQENRRCPAFAGHDDVNTSAFAHICGVLDLTLGRSFTPANHLLNLGYFPSSFPSGSWL